MALTPSGFSGGSMSDTQFGLTALPSHWIECLVGGPTTGYQVTQPSSSTRTVQINVGSAVAYGVRVVNDSAISQGMPVPSSGIQWQMVVLRRDRAAKTASIVLLAGPTTSVAGITPVGLPSGYLANPSGTQFDQPLAWVWVQSGSAVLGIFDLRFLGAGGGGVYAANTAGIALAPYVFPIGTYLTSGPADGGALGGQAGWTVVTPSAILSTGQLRVYNLAELNAIAGYVGQVNGHPLLFDGGGSFPSLGATAYSVSDGRTYYWRQDSKSWQVYIGQGQGEIGYAGTAFDQSSQTRLTRNGPTATLNMSIGVGANGANTSSANLMFSIPSWCRPPLAADFWVARSGDYVAIPMAIDTDGGVRLRGGSIGANGYFYGNVTWSCA